MCPYDVWVGWLLVVNGLYDFVCAGCIRCGCCGNLSRMHLDVLSDGGWGGDALAVHLASWWVLTYGCVRLFAGCYQCDRLDALAVFTYFIEAVAFLFPPSGKVTLDSVFVNVLCVLCGACVALRGAESPKVRTPRAEDADFAACTGCSGH
jgi:hypothetical protein